MVDSIQEMLCYKSGLYFMGCFRIMQETAVIKGIIDNIFSKYFNYPWKNWDFILRVLDWGGTTKIMETASASKHTDQGDGAKVQWQPMMSVNRGSLVQAYRIASKFTNVCWNGTDWTGPLLKDGVDLELTFTFNQQEETEKEEKWKMIAKYYETIKESLSNIWLYAFIIQPMYHCGTDTVTQEGFIYWSPQQIKLLTNFLMGTSLTIDQSFETTFDYDLNEDIDKAAICKVPWDAIDNLIPSSFITGMKTVWRDTLMDEDAVVLEYSQRIEHLTLAKIPNPDYDPGPPAVGDEFIWADYFTIPYATNLLHLQYVFHIPVPVLPPEDPDNPPVPEIPPPPPEEAPLCYGFLFGKNPGDTTDPDYPMPQPFTGAVSTGSPDLVDPASPIPWPPEYLMCYDPNNPPVQEDQVSSCPFWENCKALTENGPETANTESHREIDDFDRTKIRALDIRGYPTTNIINFGEGAVVRFIFKEAIVAP